MNTIAIKKILIEFFKQPSTQNLLGSLTTSDKEENAKNFHTLQTNFVEFIVMSKSIIDIPPAYSQFTKILYNSIPDVFEHMYEIPQASFYHCKWLTEFNVPNGVMCISENAFRDTDLKVISIPSSVTTLCKGSLDLDHPLKINYDGTARDFYKIVKDTFWRSSINSVFVNCTDGNFEMF